jgi:hypothetical protein
MPVSDYADKAAHDSGRKVRAYFDRLGDRISDEWHRVFFEERELPAIAERALLEDPPCDNVDLKDIMRWALTTRSLGLQPNGKSSFGQPPITVYAGRRFHIEVLTWLDGTTSIHDHLFVGAFCVLQGASVHSTYRFEPSKRFSTRLLLGDVNFETAEVLPQGGVRKIEAGTKLVHALYHLDHPSVSVVIRADSEDVGTQYVYFPPNVALDANDDDVWNRRALGYVDAAISINDPELAVDAARLAIHNADDRGAFNILQSLFTRHASRIGTLTEGGNIQGAPNTEKDVTGMVFDAAVVAAHEKFGAFADQMLTSCEEALRSQELAAARGTVRQAEHRFFVALLMNVPNRQRLLELVAEAYPGDPIARICGWMKELTDESSPLVHYSVGADALIILECLIRDLPASQVIERLATHHQRSMGPEEGQQVLNAMQVLRTFPLVRPLVSQTKLLSK